MNGRYLASTLQLDMQYKLYLSLNPFNREYNPFLYNFGQANNESLFE